MPLLTDAKNVYAETGVGKMATSNRDIKPLVYVPNNSTNDVTVIDPETFQVIDRFPTGGLPQHVVPSWDMSVLYVNNNTGNSLTPIDPKTGKPGPNIAVDDPYNLYFTPDGKYAIVMEERNNVIAVRDAKTFAEVKKVRTPCRGVNHADYSIDGSYFIASCEFSSQIIKFDVATLDVVADLTIAGSVPQDVRVMNDGLTFLVADLSKGGVHVVDGERFEVIGFIATGAGAHGIYPSRDSKVMYVSNRSGGSVSVIEQSSRQVTYTYRIPGGGSPDMGSVSADGRVLWLSGRYHNVVYAIDVLDWKLLARIAVGVGPHGLTYFPQPGRYSLGHTGNYR
ncbi:MAG: YncE family protein [Actinobacteria bacterium]|nr:MAG: YncE family protein [Actinomycetota bacterium]